jgi:HD-GYP domain-containing protein (c-di-GMP phosphodiesterase class II)
VDAGDVLLLNPHSQMLEYTTGRGLKTSSLKHERVRLGAAYAGRVALERSLIQVPDLSLASHARESAPARQFAAEGFRAYYSAPLVVKGQVKGVLEVFQRTPFTADSEWLEFFETLAGQAAIAIDNAQLFEGLQRSNLNLTLSYDTTIEGWSRALDLRDKETEGHTQRVTELTTRLARAMGIDDRELVHIRHGALLHDMGKMGVPDNILLKPGPLTDEEWVIMRKHPTFAYELLSPIEYLRPALDIPYCHHEKWDGTGYPRGLKGEQIPLSARAFAIVDVWDALRSDRPYRKGWPTDQVREHIRGLAGTQFDPQVVDAFLKVIGE